MYFQIVLLLLVAVQRIAASEPPKNYTCSFCGEDAECICAVCNCIPDNPDYYCHPYVGCRPKCVNDTDCPGNESCTHNLCIDPCPGSCGHNALCNVKNHRKKCVCPPRYTGSPYVACYRPIIHLPSCPSGWGAFLNNCYLFPDEKRKWQEAEDNCVRLGGHLASVNSEEEAKYIFELSRAVRLWTGANDKEEEGVYRNTDGSLVDYTNWGPAQPDNGTEDCVIIDKETLEWLPTNCHFVDRTVCKAPMAGQKCRDGWTAFKFSCYKRMYRRRGSWADTSRVCRTNGGQFSSIHSQDENAFVARMGGGIFTRIPLRRTENVNYEWEDGSPLNFTAWGSGYPRMATSQDCVRIWELRGYYLLWRRIWDDSDCEDQYQYVCKMSQKLV